MPAGLVKALEQSMSQDKRTSHGDLDILCVCGGGYPWYSGSAMGCRSTGRVVNPAPGALFIIKFISLAQIVPGPG